MLLFFGSCQNCISSPYLDAEIDKRYISIYIPRPPYQYLGNFIAHSEKGQGVGNCDNLWIYISPT